MASSPKPNRKRSTAWYEGYNANRQENKPITANPYRSQGDKNNKGDVFDEAIQSEKRLQWFNGWYDAQHQLIWPDWLTL